jgi:Dockerin type I domain
MASFDEILQKLNNPTYTLTNNGDLNGDGVIDAADLMMAER